jgi:hypothetical protein
MGISNEESCNWDEPSLDLGGHRRFENFTATVVREAAKHGVLAGQLSFAISCDSARFGCWRGGSPEEEAVAKGMMQAARGVDGDTSQAGVFWDQVGGG